MKIADENVGGVPVEVVTTRRETVMLEMKGSVALIERILEDKAIATIKQALNEYSETLVGPWSWYNDNLTVSTKEIVEAMEAEGFPLRFLLEDSGLTSWRYDHMWSAKKEYTGEAWARILGVRIVAPSFEQALVMWQEAVMSATNSRSTGELK